MFSAQLCYLKSLLQESTTTVKENNAEIRIKKIDANETFVSYNIHITQYILMEGLTEIGGEKSKIYVPEDNDFDLLVASKEIGNIGYVALAYPKRSSINNGIILLSKYHSQSIDRLSVSLTNLEDLTETFLPKAVTTLELSDIKSNVDSRRHESTAKKDITKDTTVSKDMQFGGIVNLLMMECKVAGIEGTLNLRIDGRISFKYETDAKEDDIAKGILGSLLRLNIAKKLTLPQQKSLEDVFKQ
ncbi:MAG: hypothetical protein ACP5U0_09840 [Caldisphaera sp.]